jgi:membrane protein insertase Oxa1/YidC/SpoIIIJ
MYLVEKISNLILITLEDNITETEIEEVKIQLTKIAEMAKDDVVVSINLSEKAKQEEGMQFTLENKINELLKFCYLSGLRVYSYRYC